MPLNTPLLKTIDGGDQWLDFQVQPDPNLENIQLSIYGTFNAPVTVQIRTPGSATWRDVDSFTQPGEYHGILKGPFDGRVGVKAGEFVSGAIELELRQNFTPAQGRPFRILTEGEGSGPEGTLADPLYFRDADKITERTLVPFDFSSAGDHDLYTPASGKRIRLHWVHMLKQPHNVDSPLITVKLGADVKYKTFSIQRQQQVTGPVDGHLIVNTSVAVPVAGTIVLEEI